MILAFLIIFVAASLWDVRHANRVLDTMANPGRKQTFYS